MKLQFQWGSVGSWSSAYPGSCSSHALCFNPQHSLLQVTSESSCSVSEFLHSCHLHHKRSFLHFLLHPASRSFSQLLLQRYRSTCSCSRRFCTPSFPLGMSFHCLSRSLRGFTLLPPTCCLFQNTNVFRIFSPSADPLPRHYWLCSLFETHLLVFPAINLSLSFLLSPFPSLPSFVSHLCQLPFPSPRPSFLLSASFPSNKHMNTFLRGLSSTVSSCYSWIISYRGQSHNI